MKKKKVIIINNHFQSSDGTVRALIGMVNNLDLERFDITIKPLYRCDRSMQNQLNEGIKLEKTFGFYFRGFAKLVNLLPRKFLYNRIIGGKYDIEIAFQCDLPTILVGHSYNPQAVHVSWMHCYDLFPAEYVNCDKVVCVSQYCALKTKREMHDSVDVTYRYNLINDDDIIKASKQQVFIENSIRPRFISVGRHSPEKGYIRLIKILKELKDEGYTFHLLLVGDGPQSDEIKQYIDHLEMNNEITCVGSDNNPHKYTVQSDVFICSSYREGYSTACTEASILGVPIITTAVPGGEEIINDCECGLLTTLEDSSLKAGIKVVLDNPELINEWKATLSQTSKKFSFKVRKQALQNLFDEFYQLSENKQILHI